MGMMRHLPPPGHLPEMPPGLRPPGVPRPPGAPGEPPAQQQVGGGNEDCNWRQDADEVEVTVSLPSNAPKAELKVAIQPQVLKVIHRGEAVAEGKLGGGCRP